jgi:phytoene synthase
MSIPTTTTTDAEISSGGGQLAGEARLAASRRFCRQLTRENARNFYYGLKLLPEPKRSAMFALYAYMRLADDIADADGHTVEQREHELDRWQRQTRAAFRGELPDESTREIWPAFNELVQQYPIGPRIFDDFVAGQRQDLRPSALESFEQLHEYCYRVAGVVGLASIGVWGYEGGAETEELAIARGVAFQLTNILRDLREDADRGRFYLPRADLDAMNLSQQEVLDGNGGAKFAEFMRFQIDRAESYFRQSKPLESRISRDSRATLGAMTEIYHRLLRKIAADPARVLRERVSLSVLSKLRIGWRAVRMTRHRRREIVQAT